MSRGLRVYVACAFTEKAWVRDVLHPALVEAGFKPVASWPHVEGPEVLELMTAAAVETARWSNREELREADYMLTVVNRGQPRETWCEVEYAFNLDKPMVVVGRANLTVELHKRDGLAVCVETYDAAIDVLRCWAARAKGAA